ncbi:MAG TPA: SRPBCC family protein [Actinomycetales bacterium]|nr:SRPBCC family protein [Actinomycetales bacterium]
MKISYGAVLPLPPEDAFSFVADPENWPLFLPTVRSASKNRDWGQVGGHAHLTNKVLGRLFSMDLELTEWDPPRSFRYTVSQGGKPGNDDNRRSFEPVPGGTRLTGLTEISTQAGVLGLLGHLQMRLVARVFAKAMARLPEAAARQSQPPGAAHLP